LLAKEIDANEKDGLSPVMGVSEEELGGAMFTRKDFFLERKAYETVFVKACDTQALGFVFTGSSRDAVNKLIAAAKLKLDVSKSGCASKN
jgi:hypothetical protein